MHVRIIRSALLATTTGKCLINDPNYGFSGYLCLLKSNRAVLSAFPLSPRMDPTVSQTIPEVIRTVPLQYYVFFASALFAIGVTGVLVRRNAIIIFMCVELMLNAVNILLTAFSAYRSDPNGQIFVFFIMAVAAAEVSVGLGIIVMIYRNFQTTDVNLLSRLKW
jgi:NADH-quinone oxidoreductase subunit K